MSTATSFYDIYAKFAMKTTDYVLDAMYIASTPNYYNYVKGFLLPSIAKFTQYNQDLTQRDDTTQTFSITLTDLEQEILASLMLVEWCSKEVHSVMELRNHMTDTDFRLSPPYLVLRAKQDLLITTREAIDKLITQYTFVGYDFTVDYEN